MNCVVCGNPLLYDRTVFHCSCGVFVHAYCWDEHVLQAHQPSYEIGAVNLDGEFKARESKVEEQVSLAQASEELGPEEPAPGEPIPEEPSPEEPSSEEEITPLLE
jgi:hypothetical protein